MQSLSLTVESVACVSVVETLGVGSLNMLQILLLLKQYAVFVFNLRYQNHQDV